MWKVFHYCTKVLEGKYKFRFFYMPEHLMKILNVHDIIGITQYYYYNII